MDSKKVEEWRRELETRRESQPEVIKLRGSPQFAQVVLSLRNKKRRKPIFPGDQATLEDWVIRAVCSALREPDLAETMTAGERRRVAKEIADSADRLWEAIQPFLDEKHGFIHPFQPLMDYLALEVATEYEGIWHVEGAETEGLDVEEVSHRVRFGIYHLLMMKMDRILSALVDSAEWFAETETIIKKPNDPNAKRLLFLRVITRSFTSEFGSPCRSAVLALASVFFHCGDLDEASVSKLAPVVKPQPVAIPKEDFERTLAGIEKMGEKYVANGGSPEILEEIRGHLNEMRGMDPESSG